MASTIRGVGVSNKSGCGNIRRIIILTHHIGANLAVEAILFHWRIENKRHYTRDMTLREDASRIRKNLGIFARLRSFAYNILRFNQSGSIAQDRFAAALGGLETFTSMRFTLQR